MERPKPIVGQVLHWPILREPGKRRVLFAVLILICVVLTFFPQKYLASESLTPTDPASLGLSGTLGQLGAGTSVFGSQAAIEVTLKVARSQYVRRTVADRLKLSKRLQKSPVETDRWLQRKMDISALRGGIIEFDLKLDDPELAQEIVGAFGDAVRGQLASIAREQTAFKRKILIDLVEQASERLENAQSAYDSFRLTSRYSSPQQAMNSIGDLVPQLESAIRAKQVELHAARRFGTEENIHVQQLEAELQMLKFQLEETKSVVPVGNNSVGTVVHQSTKLDRLKRELNLALILYQNYKRFLEGTSVEDLTDAANVRILEPAYVDAARQVNIIPLALGLLLILSALTLEFYIMRPPLGEDAVA